MTYPPKMPMTSPNKTSSGKTKTPATIRGVTKYLNGLVDKVVKASICSVTRIVPISAAIAAPIRPATIRADKTGASSRVTEIRTTVATALSAPKRAKPE